MLTINHIALGDELKTPDNWSGLIICIAKGTIYPCESQAKPTVKAYLSPLRSLLLSVCLSLAIFLSCVSFNGFVYSADYL